MASLIALGLLFLFAKMIAGEEYLVGLEADPSVIYITTTVGKGQGSTTITFPARKNAGIPPTGNKTESLVKENITDLYPDGHKVESCDLGPFSKCDIELPNDHFTGVYFANKSFTINTSAEDMTVSVYYYYAVFSPLPTTALGKRYILPFCQGYQTTGLFLIATGGKGMEVTITFRLQYQSFVYNKITYNDGDTLKVTLDPFETFTFKNGYFDLTGTSIEASHEFALYVGSWKYNRVSSYDQIPPVSEYGSEYMLAISNQNHTLHIISDELDNNVTFADGRNLRTRFYEEEVPANSSVHFKTSKPVLATLCSKKMSYIFDVFSVVPPIRSFGQGDVSFYPPSPHYNAFVKIIRKSNVAVDVNQFAETISPVWESTGNEEYEVGTFVTTKKKATSITGNGDFIVMIWSRYDLQVGGNVNFKGQVTSEDDEEGPLDGAPNNTTLILGIICGVVILILAIVVVCMGIYVKRLRNQILSIEGASKLPPPEVPASVVPPRLGLVNRSYDEEGYEGLNQPETEEEAYEKIDSAAF